MSPYLILVMAHSGIRYLVVLVGIIAVLYAAYGLIARPAWSSAANYVHLAFSWVVRINFLLGAILWVWGQAWTRGIALAVTHPLLMIAAVALTEMLMVRRKKASGDRDTWRLFLAGTGLPLLFILVGVVVVVGNVFGSNY